MNVCVTATSPSRLGMLVYRDVDQEIIISGLFEIFNLFDEVRGVSDVGFYPWDELLDALIYECGDIFSWNIVTTDYRYARNILLIDNMDFGQKVECRGFAIFRQ